MKKYTVGFLFSPDFRSVALIRKKRKPVHHIGKYNGLGGGFEDGESAVDCITREFMEEAGILVSPAALRPLATLSVEGYGDITAFWATNPAVQAGFRHETDEGQVEAIFLIDLDFLSRKRELVSNIQWLIQMALDDDPSRQSVLVKYTQR